MFSLLYLKAAEARRLVEKTVQLQQMTHQDTPRSVMPFSHLHIFNEVEGGRVFRQADRGETENVVDERRSGFRRQDLVILLESLRQEPPIFLVVMHTIITLRAINNDAERARARVSFRGFPLNWRKLRNRYVAVLQANE